MSELKYASVNVNGSLLSRRHIVDERDTPLTAADVESITLNIYKQVQGTTGTMDRESITNWANVNIDVSDAVCEVTEDPGGNEYNFRYCVEGAFTASNTSYIVEYRILLMDGHSIVFSIQATTTI